MRAMEISCGRCNKVVELEAYDEAGNPVPEVDGIQAAERGLLAYVCRDCLTHAEALELTRKSAAAMLDACESLMAHFDMIAQTIPAIKDDAEYKAAYAEAQAKAVEARATLDALMKLDDE